MMRFALLAAALGFAGLATLARNFVFDARGAEPCIPGTAGRVVSSRQKGFRRLPRPSTPVDLLHRFGRRGSRCP
jgi:hypothetical protein